MSFLSACNTIICAFIPSIIVTIVTVVNRNVFIVVLCFDGFTHHKGSDGFFKLMLFGNNIQNSPGNVHVYMLKGGTRAKFNMLSDVTLVENHGMKPSELKLVESIVEENKEIIN